MDDNQKGLILSVNDGFKTMREMLNEIELKISGVDPAKQFEFCKPLKHMIFEAWQDACNPDDSFLYKS